MEPKELNMAAESDDRWKNRLEPFAMMWAGIMEFLESMELGQLETLRADCDQPTRTNCWCHIYRVSQWLKPELDRRIAVEKGRPKS